MKNKCANKNTYTVLETLTFNSQEISQCLTFTVISREYAYANTDSTHGP